MAGEVEDMLYELGLQQYIPTFLEAGFDDWETFRDIQESDFLKLNVRRGDMRKLQREIARRQLWPDLRPLPTTEDLRQHQKVISRTVSVFSYSESTARQYSYSPTTSTTSISFQVSQASQHPGSYLSQKQNYNYSDIRDHISATLRDKKIIFFYESKSSGQSPADSSLHHSPSAKAYGGPKSSNPEGSGHQEALVQQVCHALTSPTPGPNLLPQDQLLQKLSDAGKSNRSSIISSRHEIHLEAFIQRLNHILHLFDEFSLRETFENIVSGHKVDDISITELMLALALGATYTGTQPHSVHLEMYIRGRLKLSTFDQWSNDLSMMRILILIVLYHLIMFPESTSYFLDLAIRLGQFHGLDSASFPLPDVPEPTRSHWLRMWKSIEFLHHWLQLSGHGITGIINETGYIINIMEPPLISEECLNSRLTQMNISVLGNLLKEVLLDNNRMEAGETYLSVVAVHLASLAKFQSELPIYFCLIPESKEFSRLVDGANDRQISSILNVHVMYLGVKCQLLQPALLQMLHTIIISSKRAEYSTQCIESAKLIVDLCQDVVGSGFNLKGHWIVLHFLFKALLILILASIQAQNTNRINTWKEKVEYISTAARLLAGAADVSPANGYRMDVIKSFLESLE